MHRYKKYSVVAAIVLLLGISLYNLSGVDVKILTESSKTIKRSKHHDFAKKFNDLQFPMIEIRNAANDETVISKISKGFVILLANNGCSPCQVRELRILNWIAKKYNEDLDILALYISNYNKMDALRLKKVSDFSYPIFQTNNRTLNSLFFIKFFPKIFYVENQKIISTLIPIPEDEAFSESYYSSLPLK